MKFKIYKFIELNSTQDYVKNLLEDYAVVIAETQTEGRGRYKRKWFSPPGGLYFSICLPKIRINLIPIIAGISVCESIHSLGIDIKMKWPNDIILNNKKLGGILCELFMDKIIMGIGINVNIEKFNEELKYTATSLLLETGKTYSIDNILNLILLKFSELYDKDSNFIIAKAKEYLILNKETEIKLPNKIIYGVPIDIDNSGALILKTSNGKIEKLITGELFFAQP